MIIIRILKRTEKLTEDESDILDEIKHYSRLYLRVLKDPSDNKVRYDIRFPARIPVLW